MQTTPPDDWLDVLGDELRQDWFGALQDFVEEQRASSTVFPPSEDVYRAFSLTPFRAVRAVILGQDPYHGPDQAEGLAFSVREGQKHPPSLRNIFKEREADLGLAAPASGSLIAWAEEGVLLLNTVLTVRQGEAHSHRNQGWEQLTDLAVQRLSDRSTPCIFVLWGKPAQKKRSLIDDARHPIVESAHPSPLSANRGFFGSRPFSTINRLLQDTGLEEIDWRVAEERA